MTAETPLEWLLERAAKLDGRAHETEVQVPTPDLTMDALMKKARERIESCKRTDIELVEYREQLWKGRYEKRSVHQADEDATA